MPIIPAINKKPDSKRNSDTPAIFGGRDGINANIAIPIAAVIELNAIDAVVEI